MNTILAALLTLLVVGAATGAAMYRVLDRGGSAGTTEDGAVVEPIYGSPSPSPDEQTDAPAQRPAPTQQRTQEPTIIIVPRHTESPTPFHDQTEQPHDTAEQDEDLETEDPTPEEHSG